MRKSRNYWIRVLLILLVVGASLLALPSYSQYCEAEYANQCYCAGYKIISPLVAWLDRHNGLIIAIFTGLLFWVAYVQNKQTEILERAYISVEGLGIEPLSADSETVAHLSVRNRGKLPARNVSWSITQELCTDGKRRNFPIPNKSYGGSLVIPPDAEMRRSQNYKFTREDFNLFTQVPRKAFFYLWGEIRYTDGFGRERVTKFCHRYDSRGLYTVSAERPHGGTLAISGESMRMHQYGNDAK